MASILAFAGSNSSSSMNFKLVKFTCGLLDHDIELINMANHTFPMYGEDREKQLGFPEAIVELKDKIAKVDALIISVNEHNSGLSAFFKNLLDWLSRVDRGYLENKKIFLMSAAPGKRGGISAFEYAQGALPRVGAKIVSTFNLPMFYTNFSEEEGIVEKELLSNFTTALEKFKAEL